jgi:DNA-binding winged helix-turn-helix (wHTH) protein
VVPLGHRAIELLCALVAAKGALVTKDELLRLVWPGLTVEENNLQVQISAVRKALQSGDDAQSYVVTVPGRGLSFHRPPGVGRCRAIRASVGFGERAPRLRSAVRLEISLAT